MGGGSKKPWWKRDTIVEDISGKEGYGPESHYHPVEKRKKKTLLSVVKRCLRKGKKNSKAEAKGGHSNASSSVIPVNNLTSAKCTASQFTGDGILPASLLPILSDSAKQAEIAASVTAANIPKRVNLPLTDAGPSNGQRCVFTQFQYGCDMNEASEDALREEECETDEEQSNAEEEMNYPLPGAVPYDSSKPAKVFEKPIYCKRAEAELKKALEKAEEEDRYSFHIPHGICDKQTQIILTRRELERMRQEKKAQKQRDRKNREETEAEKEKKRKANLKKYYEIFLTQNEKVDELTSKLQWVETKENGAQRKIDSLLSEKKLSTQQKIRLAGLKRSAKKLRSTITHTKAEIARRKTTMAKVSELHAKCKSNPSRMNENLTLTGVDLARFPMKGCWEIDTDGEREANEDIAPSTTPVGFQENDSLDEDSDNEETSSVETENSLTYTNANRFNPITLIARLHRHLSRKFKRSRPLGAHAGHMQSVTENMQQETIPYEVQHCDSNPDDEVPRTPTPIDPYGPGGKCEWLVPKGDMTLSEWKKRMSDREKYINEIKREYQKLGMDITFSIAGDPLKERTTAFEERKKKWFEMPEEDSQLADENEAAQSSSQPGLGKRSQAVLDAQVDQQSCENQEDWQLGLPAQDIPLSSSADLLRIGGAIMWRGYID